MSLKRAYFAAGCFWGVEETFQKVPGVLETAVGYMGGTVNHPTYGQVCTGKTGHAETVEVVYDPGEVTYAGLLRHFWELHDPTTPDRQGPDVGDQYRSVVFYTDEEERDLALAEKERLDRSGKYQRPVVTEVVPAGRFWRAEDYHQHYFEKMRWRVRPVR
ncbi:MAG: peptide-methionine (S)-S-oxide reductase MsrA [Methanofollis sp.]|nr:peptide-methionine (S)-S-oxide reductase MsrA [Methanofollis sp.]